MLIDLEKLVATKGSCLVYTIETKNQDQLIKILKEKGIQYSIEFGHTWISCVDTHLIIGIWISLGSNYDAWKHDCL